MLFWKRQGYEADVFDGLALYTDGQRRGGPRSMTSPSHDQSKEMKREMSEVSSISHSLLSTRKYEIFNIEADDKF